MRGIGNGENLDKIVTFVLGGSEMVRENQKLWGWGRTGSGTVRGSCGMGKYG